MADLNLKVKLNFADGPEKVLSAQNREPFGQKPAEGKPHPPYRLSTSTASSEPDLVESTSFAKFG